MAEAGLQSVERPKSEIKKVRFDENLRPEDVADFLSGWSFHKFGPTAYGPGLKPEGELQQEGWEFTKEIEGRRVGLSLFTHRKDLRWVVLYPNPGVEHKLKKVDEVEFNHQNGQVTFMGKKGHYFISNEGTKQAPNG